MLGEDLIFNMKVIINSKDYEGYKVKYLKVKLFKYL